MRKGCLLSALGIFFLGLLLFFFDSEKSGSESVVLPLSSPPPVAETVQERHGTPVPVTPVARPVEEKPVTVKEKTIIARKGDTLSRLFGKHWQAVCEHNTLKNCHQIRVGQVLRIPDFKAPDQPLVSVPQLPQKQSVPLVTKKPKDTRCINLGADPYNASHKLARTLDGIDTLTTLTTEQKYRARMLVIETHYGRGDTDKVRRNVPIGKQVFQEMLFGGTGKPRHTYAKPVCNPESKGVSELMDTYNLGDGVVLGIPRKCGNPALFTTPITPVTREAPLPAIPAVKPAVSAPLPLSAFPKKDIAEWEAIVGAGVWDNKLAHGRWHYGEGIVSAILPNGFRAGVGVFGMGGRGESDVSAYNWRERGYGPQFGVKQNFLKEQTDEFGQTALLPAMWGLKLRYLPNDRVKGHNPDSGYAQTQKGKKLGLYAEYLERRNEDWLVGVTGEIWHSFDRSITSTWSGDRPQDRGSLAINALAQYRINDDWQARGVLGGSYQNWDNLIFGNALLEARYKETLMFGPRLSVALNKPKAYQGVPWGDLTTLGAFVRLELGDTFRTWDRTSRESGVQYVGPVDPSSQ